MTGGVDLRGADQLTRGLAQMGHALEDWDALRAVAEDWRDRARRRAPKVSGRLASSLDVRRADAGAWDVFSALPYARVIHNGWAAHSIRANPFLADTVDTGEAAGILADDLAAQLSDLRGA